VPRMARLGSISTPNLCHPIQQVYWWCMSRTNIELDDALIAEVMRRYGVGTKREAVDLALRRLVGLPLTQEFLRSLRGVGWGGDLDELRSAESPRIS
jgi:Arc/MetJ family transcription regulator